MTISLIGFMGCGKSSIGRKLSELLCCGFMDLDEVIEGKSERSIPEIFASEGEGRFRQMELEALKDLMASSAWTADVPEKTIILSLGGGTVMTPECAEIVRERTFCIYLKASVGTLVKNLDGASEGRPMLHSSVPINERIEELMSLRAVTYESTAHMTIVTDGRTVEDVAQSIVQSMR